MAYFIVLELPLCLIVYWIGLLTFLFRGLLFERYLGASYDVPSLVEKLLQQLASKQTIVVHVYDTTNKNEPIKMYGDDVIDTGLLHISSLDFGDPARKHEMHCRSVVTCGLV